MQSGFLGVLSPEFSYWPKIQGLETIGFSLNFQFWSFDLPLLYALYTYTSQDAHSKIVILVRLSAENLFFLSIYNWSSLTHAQSGTGFLLAEDSETNLNSSLHPRPPKQDPRGEFSRGSCILHKVICKKKGVFLDKC